MPKTSFAKLVDPIRLVHSKSVFLKKGENVSRRFLLELPCSTTTGAAKRHAVLLGPAVPIILRQEFPVSAEYMRPSSSIQTWQLA